MTTQKPFTIASVAKTLAELKALPVAKQAMLLLRRLVAIEGQMRDGFHKGNFLLPGYSWAIGDGFQEADRSPVTRLLFGAPWARLVNDGLLVDPNGSGFFTLTDEGREAGKAIREDLLSAHAKSRGSNPAPTAFISYSWDNGKHKDWVRTLAERLRADGVDVTLDQWDLKPGSDRTHFMENAVSNSDFVVIICTPTYAERSNKRQGGVGYEATIITGELARNVLQNKFIPILRAGGWNDTAIPVWLATKIGIDFVGDPYKESSYWELLQTLHSLGPAAPPLGAKPDFLSSVSPSKQGLAPNAVTAHLQLEQPAPSSDLVQTPLLSPIAYAWYETRGTNADRIQVYVRPTASAEQPFVFETSKGGALKGTESQVESRYLEYDLELRKIVYFRMQTFNGTGGKSFNLP